LPTLPDGGDAYGTVLPALRCALEQCCSTKFSRQYSGHQSATGASQAGYQSFCTGTLTKGDGKRFVARATKNTGAKKFSIARQQHILSIHRAFVNTSVFVYSTQILYTNEYTTAVGCARPFDDAVAILCRHAYEAGTSAGNSCAGSDA
jgi:hypothetical protein